MLQPFGDPPCPFIAIYAQLGQSYNTKLHDTYIVVLIESKEMNFSASKQVIRPPQRGIFPLDHESECKSAMKVKLIELI